MLSKMSETAWQGNICPSAFAMHPLRQRYKQSALNHSQLSSHQNYASVSLPCCLELLCIMTATPNINIHLRTKHTNGSFCDRELIASGVRRVERVGQVGVRYREIKMALLK